MCCIHTTSAWQAQSVHADIYQVIGNWSVIVPSGLFSLCACWHIFWSQLWQAYPSLKSCCVLLQSDPCHLLLAKQSWLQCRFLISLEDTWRKRGEMLCNHSNQKGKQNKISISSRAEYKLFWPLFLSAGNMAVILVRADTCVNFKELQYFTVRKFSERNLIQLLNPVPLIQSLS